MYKMIRMSDETSQYLDGLAKDTGESKQELMAEAVKYLHRKYMFEKANQAYEKLKADPEKWKKELEERALWDTTLLDGLEDDDYEY